MSALRTAVVLDAARTPIGRAKKGRFVHTRIDDMAAHLVRALLVRNPGVAPADVEDLLAGCAYPEAEQGLNVARHVAQLAGLPVATAAATVNRLCASSLQTAVWAAMACATGGGELFVSVGLEHMSAIPQGGHHYARSINPTLFPHGRPSMPQTGQNVAEAHGVTRADQDAFALRSHQRALAAQAAGRFGAELIPTPARDEQGAETLAERDECPRAATTLDKLAALEPLPALTPWRDGPLSITAGNACPLNDGASAALIAHEDYARRRGLRPLARFVAQAVVGVAPELMGLGPIPAVQKALARAGLTVADIDLFEINEAFASQVLACLRALAIPEEKVNVNGGALALGHPLGCTGTRMIATLVHELARRPRARYGLVTQCIGGGQGMAVIFERAAA